MCVLISDGGTIRTVVEQGTSCLHVFLFSAVYGMKCSFTFFPRWLQSIAISMSVCLCAKAGSSSI